MGERVPGVAPAGPQNPLGQCVCGRQRGYRVRDDLVGRLRVTEPVAGVDEPTAVLGHGGREVGVRQRVRHIA